MRNVLGVFSMAAAVALSAPASATTYFLNIPQDKGSEAFGKSNTWYAGFTNYYLVNIPKNGFLTGFVESFAGLPSLDVSLRNITLNGTPISKISSGNVDLWSFNNVAVSAGRQSIGVTGYWGADGGSYAGKVSFSTTSAVPEPAAWAMMIAGFGLVGASMRRRRKVAVSYS